MLAILIEDGEPLSWKKMGNYLNVSRLQMMTYSEEIEEMVKKRWFTRRACYDMGRGFEGFALAYGDLEAYCRAEQLNTKKEHKPVGFKL